MFMFDGVSLLLKKGYGLLLPKSIINIQSLKGVLFAKKNNHVCLSYQRLQMTQPIKRPNNIPFISGLLLRCKLILWIYCQVVQTDKNNNKIVQKIQKHFTWNECDFIQFVSFLCFHEMFLCGPTDRLSDTQSLQLISGDTGVKVERIRICEANSNLIS